MTDQSSNHNSTEQQRQHDADTSVRIGERNRKNALKSTGPRTPNGKAIACRNSLKHGLCANPTSGVMESGEEFEALHNALKERIAPRDTLEDALVHRIAHSLWRLQRAARIDAAVSDLAISATTPDRRHIQDWIERIQNSFACKQIEVRVQVTQNGQISHVKESKLIRPGLVQLDEMIQSFDGQIRKECNGIEAMKVMLTSLREKLSDPRSCYRFHPLDAQVMSWLLGESAERLGPEYGNFEQIGGKGYIGDGQFYPDERPWRSHVDDLIGRSRKNDSESEDHLFELDSLINCRLSVFDHWQKTCGKPNTVEHAYQQRVAALLPDDKTMNRIIRYETHADRTFQRALETLARLRGASVETVMARVTRHEDDGTLVEVQGQRKRLAGMDH